MCDSGRLSLSLRDAALHLYGFGGAESAQGAGKGGEEAQSGASSPLEHCSSLFLNHSGTGGDPKEGAPTHIQAQG